jgi:hypothetical protein
LAFTDPDGFPVPIRDNETDLVDCKVARYWREHGFDMPKYMEKNWKKIGSSLVGNLHFICGEMDNFYLNLGVYRMESFLKSTSDPAYGALSSGGGRWGAHDVRLRPPHPMGLLEAMADHITRNAPKGEDTKRLRY